MATMRTHVILPAKLAQEIDALVGPRGRSAFLVEIATAEVKRRQLKAFLHRKEPVWTDENHPEIAASGAAVWVRSQRDEKSDRQKRLEEKLEMTGV
jgi:hypothetical protein